MNEIKRYDAIIVGGGHSGIEAALASARMGCETALFTAKIDDIGVMPCNPSIGGPAKGQIVGEVDALGGEMGRAADATQIQMKVLNRSRGPAVQCLRSQNDKYLYNAHMRDKVLSMPGLTTVEGMVDDIIVEDKTIRGIVLKDGSQHFAKTVVLTTGTFLQGKIHIGLDQQSGGRIDAESADGLSNGLSKYGFRLGRLKTGTPPRLARESIDVSVMKEAPGDDEFLHFSFRTKPHDGYKNQGMCYLTATTPDTHEIILDNLHVSPMFSKVIKGSGPRYCPSIEDKVYRFKDKDNHHIFIEPESWDTNEIYPQGLNTSMPADVQDEFLRSIPGLENVEVLRPGYAVEYDFSFPDQLYPTLETRLIKGLFFAGQLNGTSGYEEAAGQGIIAGINAAASVLGKDPFILRREESFIGTMIDDLIEKNIYEPYRMLTSRSEFRLLLRQDNATNRLSEKAYEYGLLNKDEITLIRQQNETIRATIKSWRKSSTPAELMKAFHMKQSMLLYDFLKRPEVSFSTLLNFDLAKESDREVCNKALVEVKYEGYIAKQAREIDKIKRFLDKQIPDSIDFFSIQGLRKESQEKFNEYRPKTIFDAQKIAGINPADIMVLIAYFEKYRTKDWVRKS